MYRAFDGREGERISEGHFEIRRFSRLLHRIVAFDTSSARFQSDGFALTVRR